jgi:hypothetical protein
MRETVLQWHYQKATVEHLRLLKVEVVRHVFTNVGDATAGLVIARHGGGEEMAEVGV